MKPSGKSPGTPRPRRESSPRKSQSSARFGKAKAKPKAAQPADTPRPEAKAAARVARRPRFRVWLALAVLFVAALGWLFRPWSAYSPFEMLGALDPRRRVEVLRSFDEILPHRVIAARADAPRLRRREAPIDAAYEWNGERKLVESFLEQAAVTGLFVLDDGVIVHERYRLGASAETRFATFGLSEGVVGALIGAAVADGLIESLDDPVERYARQFRGTDYGATRLRDLMAKSGGFARPETERALGSDVRDLYLRTFVLGADPDRIVRSLRRRRPAGEALDLAATDVQTLAAVVRTVYDAPLAEVVETKIWSPFGMTARASWSQHVAGPRGSALGFCCWNASLQDIARFGELLRRDGAWQETRLLPEGFIEEAAQPAADYAAPGADPALAPWGQGLLVYVPEDARGEFLLAGEYGQYLWIDRRQGIVVAMTAADPDWRTQRGEATAVLRAIVAAAAEL
jgi:CubicO group peptidase (beta-lactamase class C family)